MSWREDVIGTHVAPIAQLLVDAISDFEQIIVSADVDVGVSGVGAIYYDLSGTRRGVSFDELDRLEPLIQSMHAVYAKNGADWKSMKLEVTEDGDFNLEFDYEVPLRWHLDEFPKQR
jgi:YezG-like immunity protein